MAGITVNELDEITEVPSDSYLVVDNGTETNKVSKENLLKQTKTQENIENFKKFVITTQSGEEDWAPAINQCLSTHNSVYIPYNITISSPIELSSGQQLKGFSKNTIIKANTDFSGSAMIKLKDDSVVLCIIKDICLNGNASNQGSNTFKGISLEGNTDNQTQDARFDIRDIFITRVPGDAFVLTGRGESHISHIFCRWNNGNGFVINCWDTFFDNLSSGVCKGDGYVINGANLKFVYCKKMRYR